MLDSDFISLPRESLAVDVKSRTGNGFDDEGHMDHV